MALVTQDGITDTSFVYQDANQFTDKKNVMTDYIHWTTFSFSGTILVTVKKHSGDIGSCSIHPFRDDITPEISGSTLKFTISEPKKLWLEMPGLYEHPLFIFADAPEEDIPDKNDANVVFVHLVGWLFFRVRRRGA